LDEVGGRELLAQPREVRVARLHERRVHVDRTVAVRAQAAQVLVAAAAALDRSAGDGVVRIDAVRERPAATKTLKDEPGGWKVRLVSVRSARNWRSPRASGGTCDWSSGSEAAASTSPSFESRTIAPTGARCQSWSKVSSSTTAGSRSERCA